MSIWLNRHRWRNIPVWKTPPDMQTREELQENCGGKIAWAWLAHTHIHTHRHKLMSHVVSTVAGLVGTRSSRKLIGQSRANGMAQRGFRFTWAAGEVQRRKQSVTHWHVRKRLFLIRTERQTNNIYSQKQISCKNKNALSAITSSRDGITPSLLLA